MPEAGVDYDVTDLDPTSLCFDASALPESFVSDGEIPLDNATAAEVYADCSPDLVAGLAACKGFVFEDQGEVSLKGFDRPVRLYEVRWQKD